MKKEYTHYVLLTPDGKQIFNAFSGRLEPLRRDTYLLAGQLLHDSAEYARYRLNRVRDEWREVRERKYGLRVQPYENPREAVRKAKANLAALRWVRPYPVKITVDLPDSKPN